MITTPLKRSAVSSSSEERLIRALIQDENDKGFYAATFQKTEIEIVISNGKEGSALVLRSGAKIPVALTYEELEQKIYRPDLRANDDAVLDLRDVTGEAAQPKQSAANSNQLAIGDKMPDGTVYAGVSPDTGKAMFATPEDAPLTMKWKAAMKYAKDLDAYGHQDWRVPTKDELNVLFNNRAAIGGFNVTGSNPAGWYWSSSTNDVWDAWAQRFSDGHQFFNYKDLHSSVRCVR